MTWVTSITSTSMSISSTSSVHLGTCAKWLPPCLLNFISLLKRMNANLGKLVVHPFQKKCVKLKFCKQGSLGVIYEFSKSNNYQRIPSIMMSG
jgi:hypothetical protein